MVKRTLSAAKRVSSTAVATARKVVARGTGAPDATTRTTAAPAEKTARQKAAATKTATKKAAATKTATKKAATKTATKKTATKKTATKKTATTKAATKKTATKKTATKKAAGTSGTKATAALPFREDESRWTAAQVREVRAELSRDIAQLTEELDHAESDLVDLMRDSGDGAGDDEADAGAKTYEREQEISLANNAREMLQQATHALERLEDGSYGTCEACGRPIGKLRLQAAPRATLCLTCKTKQERR